MKRAKFIIMLILAGLVASLTGCSAVSSDEKKSIVAFYMEFAKEATSLNADKISETYSTLAKQNFEGQSANAVRDKMFAEFNNINPDFFSKIQMTDSNYSEVGQTYSNILLLSLATNGAGVAVTMPSDAVSAHKDEKLGKTVYEIDRTKITATVPEELSAKVTRPNRNGLAPVRLIKDGDSWKVLADKNMLTEIGIPLDEKISAPTTK